MTTSPLTVTSVSLTANSVVVKAKNDKAERTSTYPLSRAGMKSRHDIDVFIKEQDINDFYRSENGIKAVLLEAWALTSGFSNEQLKRQAEEAKKKAKTEAFINKIRG